MAPSIKEPAESSRPASPSEVTTLLPQSSTSRPHTPKLYGHGHGHGRKPSVAGSVRGGGPVVATGNRPSPTQQVARVSKRGQRRILTTPLLRTIFFALVVGTFLSLVLTLVLFINTATDLSSVLLPTRGSGFAEFWMAFIGAWMGVGGVIFFSHPSLLFFFTTFLSLILLFPILLLSLLSPGLKRIHNPLLLLPLLLTLFTGILTLLSSYLVRRARTKESRRVVRMVTDGVGHSQAVRDEAVARALVGMDKRKWYHKVLSFLGGVLGFIAGLATLLLVTLMLLNMSLEAYDFATPLPSPHSQLVSVKPSGASTAYNVHIACVPPGNDTHHRRELDFMPSFSSHKSSNLPTVLYEAPSGVPGSLSLLHAPLPPSGESAHLPGKWLFKLQDEGKVGTICVWDRPGYGFSEVATDSDIGSINRALWMGLEKVLSKKQVERGFVLVGEGYGGILSRVFASQHPSHIKGLVHIEAQTAQTYFNENPRNLSAFRLFVHRIATRLFPSLLTPLGLPSRLPSAIFRRSTSESRVLASVYPKPDTSRLNQRLQKARLQETFASHSHISHSFRTLLDSERHYPSSAPAVVLSSRHHMDTDENWKQGQKGLWEEVTGEEGRRAGEWVVLKGDVGGRHVCESQEGAKACAKAVQKVLMA